MGAAARGEGRFPVAATEASNEAAIRPSGQRVAAPFQAAERRPASRQRFVVAPVGAKTIDSLWPAPIGAGIML